MSRLNRSLVIVVGIVTVGVTGFFGWRAFTEWNGRQLCEAVEQRMEQAYAVKGSSRGQHVVAAVGSFPITYGDVVVLAQELVSYRANALSDVRPAGAPDLQDAFNALTFRALVAMAAKEHGTVVGWNEVKRRRIIEYEGFVTYRWGARCGVARSRLRHLDEDQRYHVMDITGAEVVSADERMSLQGVDRERAADIIDKMAKDRLQRAIERFPLIIYDDRFTQPPWIRQLGGKVSGSFENRQSHSVE